MTGKNFEELVYNATESLETESQTDESLEILRESARGLARRLGTPAQVRVEPGFSVNMGQQYNIIIRIPMADQPGYTGTLFRAYIPVDGYPVTLDLFGEQGTVCNNSAELTKAILEFLKLANVQQRLKALKDLAA